MREKCPSTEFFLVRIFLYSDLQSKSPYSVRIQENTDQKKLVFGHSSYSENFKMSVFAGDQKLTALVENISHTNIFGYKGVFNMKLLEITIFNKNSEMVRLFLNFY